MRKNRRNRKQESYFPFTEEDIIFFVRQTRKVAVISG